MIASLVITFRETLEVALIVGIVFSYLRKTRQTLFNNVVYLGIGLGIVASIIGAWLFEILAGGFSGRAEQIFEGITMIIGALLLTTMILWMMKQKQIAAELENKVATELKEAHKFGLFFLVFISVLREGIETVIFLGAASFVSSDNNLIGAFIGILAAIVLGYVIFIGSKKINIKKFFNITSILLIFFAGGLVASSIHEFQEALIIPTVVEHIWDINPGPNSDGSIALLHEDGYIGSIFKGLFGYNGDPSLIEVIGYLSYMLIIFFLWKNIKKNYNFLK